jgi:hypothetical protein
MNPSIYCHPFIATVTLPGHRDWNRRPRGYLGLSLFPSARKRTRADLFNKTGNFHLYSILGTTPNALS